MVVTWFVVCAVVAVLLRIEYLVAMAVLNTKVPDWSDTKKRIFAVRVVSFTHATVSALACLTSLLTNFEYVKEPYHYHKESAEYVLLWSMGYFFYDLSDMYYHGEFPSSKEYIVHHSLVIICFSIMLITGKLFGFAMIGLLVEVQTIFLHLRTMVRVVGVKRGQPLNDFLINANMICLFLFRHLPVSYLLCFLLGFIGEGKAAEVPMALRFLLIGGLSFLTYHNIHLTMAMMKSDGFFGYEMQTLDEDCVDPLGPVNSSPTKSNGKAVKAE